ncbi:flagellar basal body P-ring formation chaperone FlgA [uncultured Agrobacterium sp.]|uniref:flagellar basal body P-ring formation chaperone FlgA n=2 Tax=uncultured Agrobacterium sp. TaxID=157277 RepID=UPI0025DF2994|nr:flagellar basal body P-ring formation chaperone FlgA [uncultured Agrobacterium sp.]
MKFRPKIMPVQGRKAVFVMALAVSMSAPGLAMSQQKFAVVPTATIFSGEVITHGLVTEVPVTNPNIAPGYSESVKDVVGKVSKRTLVAGRTIPLGDLRDPYAVERGATVRITYSKNGMNLSASGVAIEDAMAGDVVRVRNKDTGVTINGTAMRDGTVEVLQQ